MDIVTNFLNKYYFPRGKAEYERSEEPELEQETLYMHVQTGSVDTRENWELCYCEDELESRQKSASKCFDEDMNKTLFEVDNNMDDEYTYDVYYQTLSENKAKRGLSNSEKIRFVYSLNKLGIKNVKEELING
jgi:hypothetical protein